MTAVTPGTTPPVTLADWRAQVDKELGGAAFEKALVHTTAEGIAVQPLYVESAIDPGLPGAAPFTRGASAAPAPFRICMRPRDAGQRGDDLAGGAEALWIEAGDLAATLAGSAKVFLVVDGPARELEDALSRLVEARASFALAVDPVGDIARGTAKASLGDALERMGAIVRRVVDAAPGSTGAMISTLPYHAAGADAAEELSNALSTGVVTLGALLDAGLDVATAARQIVFQVALGRDTFVELAKLRALRQCWHKVLAASGAPSAAPGRIHAVSSTRTLTDRDPWVNMLRVTTQVFAGVLGGADLVTPAAFDELAKPSSLGHRIARNTALVLREESHLGRVVDPAGGSYYLETLTDALAREGWQRFRALEKDGGVVRALESGALATRLEAAWKKRRDAIGKRKEPILGVSEFANLDEQRLPRASASASVSASASKLPAHRDSEGFERLRDHADALAAGGNDVLLLTLGPPSEHRGRVGFSSAFFAAGGLRAHESAEVRKAPIAVICGSDERYAAEAAAAVQALKAAGCGKVVLAGRPGALEADLRAAGCDGFIFVGADVVATLSDLIGGAS